MNENPLIKLIGNDVDPNPDIIGVLNGRLGFNLARFRTATERTPEQLVELVVNGFSWEGTLADYHAIESGDRPLTAVELTMFAMALGFAPQQVMLAFFTAPARTEVRVYDEEPEHG